MLQNGGGMAATSDSLQLNVPEAGSRRWDRGVSARFQRLAKCLAGEEPHYVTGQRSAHMPHERSPP